MQDNLWVRFSGYGKWAEKGNKTTNPGKESLPGFKKLLGNT